MAASRELNIIYKVLKLDCDPSLIVVVVVWTIIVVLETCNPDKEMWRFTSVCSGMLLLYMPQNTQENDKI